MLRFPRKTQHHILDHVASLTRFHKGYVAVKCKNCGQQFVMDMIGGWMVEWDFAIADDGMLVDKDSFDAAVTHLQSSYNTTRIKNHIWEPCKKTIKSKDRYHQERMKLQCRN